MGIKVCFITSLDVNVGDEFIREGISSFLDEIYTDWNPYYVNKVELETIYKKIKDEKSEIGDKLVNADVIIQAGAPVYWNFGNSTSYNVEWADELWFKRIFRLGPEKPILNIAAGACQPYPDSAKSFLSDPKCVDFARNIDRACRWTSVRDPLASQILYALNIKHDVLPCAAFHAARRLPALLPDPSLVGINLMPLGGHFKLREDVDSGKWKSAISDILPVIRKNHKIIFIAHDKQEEKFMSSLALSGEKIFISEDYRDYMKVYSSCSIVIANRVHGAVCAAGFGNSAIIIGNDTRLQIADYIGIPSHYVGSVSTEQILADFEKAVEDNQIERDRLLSLREETAERYRDAIRHAIGSVNGDERIWQKRGDAKIDVKLEALKLGSIRDIDTNLFMDFMRTMNCFAERLELRTFTNWSKVWEYPWLWFNGISGRDWSKISVLDLGSEISPMPWFLASLGAKVTLIECDPQWCGKWENLKRDTGLQVDWRIVKDEVLPFENNSFDLVSSFSVIEHQKDKQLAIDEVIRVLKPGGTFALSFDICEPEMGMTFPEWNGRALTMKEFEELVWNNTGFVYNPAPEWNTEDIPQFIEWHLKSATHHNYTVGAAVLKKKIIDETTVKKVLLPRFDTHGDIVLLQGFVQAILEKLPGVEVTILVREGYDQLAPLFPERLKWRTLAVNPYSRYSDDELEDIRRVFEGIAAEEWDLVLFTTYNRTFLEDLLAAWLKNLCKVALGKEPEFMKWQQRAFAKLGLQFPTFDYVLPVEELSHETEKYKAFGKVLFDKNFVLPLPVLKKPESMLMQVDQILTGLNLKPGEFVACLPAGIQNVKIKKWPEERYAEVLVWLSREHGITPLILGHESERDVVEKVAEFVRKQNVVPQIWIGKTGELVLLGGLLKNARFYFGNDTGPMHMAAAMGQPVVAVFGGGHWPRFLPVGDTIKIVVGILPCFYCNWQCIFENAPCVSLISVEEVKTAISSLLCGNKNEVIFNTTQSICSTALEFASKATKTTLSLRDESNRRQEVIETLTESLFSNTEQCNKLIQEMKVSLSWRITAPLRNLMDIIRKL